MRLFAFLCYSLVLLVVKISIISLLFPYYRCDPHALKNALCKRAMVTPEEIIEKSLDSHGAAVSRDGLAKTIYCRLFDW